MPLDDLFIRRTDHDDRNAKRCPLREKTKEHRSPAGRFTHADERHERALGAGQFLGAVDQENDADGDAEGEDAFVGIGEEGVEHGREGRETPILYTYTLVFARLSGNDMMGSYFSPSMMDKPFDQWNIVKQRIEARVVDPLLYFHEREVWWCSTGINIGVETDGKNEHFERPVLILKKFNGLMLWVVPLTSREHNSAHYCRITHDKGVSFACLSQLRTVSSKRLLRKIGMISMEDFDAVRNLVTAYIKIGPR